MRTYVYDADGRMIGEYGVSAADVKAETIWLSPEVNGSGQLWGGDDGVGGYAPLAVATGTAGTLYWVHGNHLGVPVVTTDSAGNPAAPTGFTRVGFPGQTQTLADLYYNEYRDYDPTTGRYIQADPIGLDGGSNPYAYAGNNPIRFTDPLGLQPTAVDAIKFGAQWWLKRQVKHALLDEIPVVGEAVAFGEVLGATAAVLQFLYEQPCAKALEMAENNKQTRKKIAGLQAQIDEHMRKINQNPNDPAANHWRGEVSGWKSTIERLQRRLPNGR
ncbi:MAG: RHS repeat-associated core domain-containing protein [Sphingomonas bacterium]